MRELVANLRATMADESTIDLDRHAERVARTVFDAKRATTQAQAAAVRTWLADARHESAANGAGGGTEILAPAAR